MSRHWLTLLCGAFAVLFASLGVWQVERLKWKLDLIAAVDARLAGAPAPVPRSTWPTISAKNDAYRRVIATGEYLQGKETLVQALTEDGPGWWVMTPLRTDDGDILINRGFVSDDHRAPSMHPTPQGRQTVTGLLRMTEPEGGFLRANDPASDRWHSRDVEAIAKARALTDPATFFIDADATTSPTSPKGGMTVVHFRNAHLVYALTWFALCALSLTGAWLVQRRTLSGFNQP